MTAPAGRGAKLRRTVRSMPLAGPLLASLSVTYHRTRARIANDLSALTGERLPGARDAAAVAIGASLSDRARRLLLAPYRRESVASPAPLVAGGHCFDVVEDLVEFTSLSRNEVHELIARRIENFRTEWLQWPASLRADGWFYLSSRTYLFANAIHFHDAPALVDDVAAALPPGGQILDLGGGTANLTLALAARGFDVDYHELSALQKEFARYRVEKHGLDARVRILDSWAELPAERYDGVCAVDVLEHLPDLATVVGRIAAALVTGGVLIDASSFGAGLANPMHHEDPGLDGLLASEGLVLTRTVPVFRVWMKRR